MSKENDPIELIKKIRDSNNHDDVAAELYEALCPGETPPYKKWVATWILKCINNCNDLELEQKEYLYASFALLEGYTLKGTPIKSRLAQYMKDSDYTTKHDSTKQNRTYQQIADAPDGETEIAKMLKNLCRYERMAVNTLSEYITNEISLKEIPEHITELNEYGTKLKDGSGYKHNPQQLTRYDPVKDFGRQDMLDQDMLDQDMSEHDPPSIDTETVDNPMSIEENLCALASILLNAQIKLRVIARIRGCIIAIIMPVLIVTAFSIFTIHTRNSKQIEPGQIQHEGVTYSEIQQEETSTENALLNKPIFKKISVHDENDKRVEHIEMLAGEGSILVVHFSPGNADKDKLNITSSDTGLLNVGVLDAGMSGKLPFLAEAEEKWDAENYKTSILVQGQGAIPACVNVTVAQNIPKQYNNNDMQNGGTLESGGLKNEGQK